MFSQLYVVRHGATPWNLAGRVIGQQDPKLASLGISQANDLAHRLSTRFFSVVYTSPLARAVETASIIASRCGVPVVKIGDLIEASFGQLEGRMASASDVISQWTERSRDKYRFEPPGGESYRTVEARVERFISSLAQDARCVVVTHVGVIRVMAHLYGGISEEAAGVLSPGHGKIWELTSADGQGRFGMWTG